MPEANTLSTARDFTRGRCIARVRSDGLMVSHEAGVAHCRADTAVGW